MVPSYKSNQSVLIHKESSANKFKKFGLFSLSNFKYKIFSKISTYVLTTVIRRLVCPYQRGITRKRNFIYNIDAMTLVIYLLDIESVLLTTKHNLNQ